MFQNSNPEGTSLHKESGGPKKTRMSDVTAEEFASMGLRTGQKRSRPPNQAHSSSKKSKKKVNNGTLF